MTPDARLPPPHADLEITPRDVHARRENGDDLILVDCRTEEEHRFARIGGDRLIPLAELEHRWPELGEDRARPVVVYCHTGRRSLMATIMLRSRGFTEVRSMAGGIHRWSLEIDASVPRY